ncbi:hypothetical protein M011DRAFT_186083 [Sporormia fimetaria CBS 119925]|uniref:Uncharacterized protein n=1 Tax=Sporormia fimetaria CBS 119925 TaxID=1340428 RepID=A0A6A6VM26_9PLEO|nr:hypothetical protein M011DRAFT_186083 [Sporormia fimetaria CBS 119925]
MYAQTVSTGEGPVHHREGFTMLISLAFKYRDAALSAESAVLAQRHSDIVQCLLNSTAPERKSMSSGPLCCNEWLHPQGVKHGLRCTSGLRTLSAAHHHPRALRVVADSHTVRMTYVYDAALAIFMRGNVTCKGVRNVPQAALASGRCGCEVGEGRLPWRATPDGRWLRPERKEIIFASTLSIRSERPSIALSCPTVVKGAGIRPL